MLTAMLFDDEKPALLVLTRMLEATGAVRVEGAFQTEGPFVEAVRSQKPDVVFLDIETPGKNGLQLAGELAALSPGTDCVFVTAYRQYALDAFDANAVDYLLKPVQAERLQRTVARLAARRRAHLPAAQPGASFMLRCMGSFTLANGSGEALRWPTQKAAELAAFLWLGRDHVVSVPALTENVWSNLDDVRARNNLYTTVYNLKKALAQFCGDALRIEKKSGGYQLCTKLPSDVERIQDLLAQMDGVSLDDRLGCFRKVMELYTGALFESEGYLWAQSAQTFLQTEIEKRGIRLAARLMRQSLLQEAQDVLQLLLLRDPCFETAYLFLVRLYDRLPDAASAQLTYTRYCQVMREELGLTPKPFADVIRGGHRGDGPAPA